MRIALIDCLVVGVDDKLLLIEEVLQLNKKRTYNANVDSDFRMREQDNRHVKMLNLRDRMQLQKNWMLFVI